MNTLSSKVYYSSGIFGSRYISSLQKVKEKHSNIYIIISPPRCSSTAFSRVFWEHPSVSFYCHEPFDTTYYKKFSTESALYRLHKPLNVIEFKTNDTKDNSLVIKEMTFQVGQNFRLLVYLTKLPVIFLIRDPRLCILSRIKKLQEGGRNPSFPFVESGWFDLNYQINYCKKLNIPYLIVDSKYFRSYPQTIFKKVFTNLELAFSAEMLSWKETGSIKLGNLGDEQKHWYRELLESTGIKPENNRFPEISALSGAMKNHLHVCLEIYKTISKDSNAILPY